MAWIWNASTIILNTTAFRHTASSEEFAIFDTEPHTQSRKHIPTLNSSWLSDTGIAIFSHGLTFASNCILFERWTPVLNMQTWHETDMSPEIKTWGNHRYGKANKKKNYSYCRVKTCRKRTLFLSVCQHRPLCSLCVNSISPGTIWEEKFQLNQLNCSPRTDIKFKVWHRRSSDEMFHTSPFQFPSWARKNLLFSRKGRELRRDEVLVVQETENILENLF